LQLSLQAGDFGNQALAALSRLVEGLRTVDQERTPGELMRGHGVAFRGVEHIAAHREAFPGLVRQFVAQEDPEELVGAVGHPNAAGFPVL
jgi:hypothetical protein